MAYDETLADRIRTVLRRRKGFTETKMFGGLAFLHKGNMCCGVVDQCLVLRLGETGASQALAKSGTKPMDFTGKPMKTMVYVEPSACRSEARLKNWVDRAVSFSRTLPAKR